MVGGRATWSCGDLALNSVLQFGEPPPRTGADGRFRIDCIPAGLTIRLVLHAQGSERVWHSVENLTVQPSEVKNLGDLPGAAR